jgi:hypothetical protein
MKGFRDRLARLRGTKCEGVQAEEYEEPGDEPIFSVGTSIRFSASSRSNSGLQMWRIISTVQWPSTSESRYAARALSFRKCKPSTLMVSDGTANRGRCERTRSSALRGSPR